MIIIQFSSRLFSILLPPPPHHPAYAIPLRDRIKCRSDPWYHRKTQTPSTIKKFSKNNEVSSIIQIVSLPNTDGFTKMMLSVYII